MIRSTFAPPGRLAKLLGRQTARIPSNTFLWAAGGSILLSLFLRRKRRHDDAIFVGHWVPTLLSLALYSKIARLIGRA